MVGFLGRVAIAASLFWRVAFNPRRDMSWVEYTGDRDAALKRAMEALAVTEADKLRLALHNVFGSYLMWGNKDEDESLIRLTQTAYDAHRRITETTGTKSADDACAKYRAVVGGYDNDNMCAAERDRLRRAYWNEACARAIEAGRAIELNTGV